MHIPPRFDTLLRKNQGLCGAVEQTLGRFEIWLKDNKVVFFPEYTDHGPEHIESVMRGAAELIREESWQHLTAEDAAVMLLSILLHDCAMQLSQDGFLALITPGSTWAPRGKTFLDGMADLPWPGLWDEFLREATRFDAEKLVALFGDPEPVRRPPENWAKWTRNDHLLIGEFLRRHHARLAHEIALAGIPGPGPERLEFAAMEDWLCDLSGFVARSHNLDLRLCADRMPDRRRRVFRDVHAPFAMAVLRIADYLEIEAPRAPRELLRVRSLKSPLSRAEWRKHWAVHKVQLDEHDPEALYVDAEPLDVKTFLGLQRLLGGIQQELDSCWAVLGEVYGADASLRDLGLCVRRIRSSIDDTTQFGNNVDYLPVHARFQVASGEMLKLMVGPLYGNDPSFGVRELMANAVDACREREDFERQNEGVKLDLPDLEADVVVFLEENEDGTGRLTVEDRGIGMTPDVVCDYFLTAGASFRNSQTWHRRHDDEIGHPRVLRGGRFGIGVLAAFLLGDEIDVTTRHVTARRGVRFTCRLEDPEIELRWCERTVGTTVRINVPERVCDELLGGTSGTGGSWDWYALDRPTLIRKVLTRNPHSRWSATGRPIELRRKRIPMPHANLPAHWARLQYRKFEDIQWTWGVRELFPAFVLVPRRSASHLDRPDPDPTGRVPGRCRRAAARW